MFMKIGHHGGAGGRYDGITAAWRLLTDLGIPATFGSADHAGTVYELAQMADASGVQHNMFWRATATDVPPYHLDPHVAALHHWQNLRSRIPPELLAYKHLIWIVSINEPGRVHADWLGWFSTELSILMLNDGFKHLAFGWSSGTPEYAHWEEPGMIQYLELCAEHPNELGIALHEYSYSRDDITRFYPYLLGRFFMPFDVCDDLGIARPTTMITEWGWEYRDVPALQRGLHDIHWAASLYYSYPQIKGAMGWYLGDGYGNIDDQFVQYIAPMATMAQAFEPEEVELPIDPTSPVPEETLEQYLWRISIEEQKAHGLSLNADAALQAYFYQRDYNIVIDEMGGQYEGEQYTIQAGEDLSDIMPRMVDVWQPGEEIWTITEPSIIVPEPGDPLQGFKIGPIFRLPYTLTSPYGIPRDYDGDDIFDDRHEGADYDILIAVSDSKEPVLSGVAGRVRYAGNSGGAYGWFVIIETVYNGHTIHLWYAHMDQLYVQTGQDVVVGTYLGELGDTGGDWAEHVHLNMQVPGLGSQDPAFPVPDTIDPAPYVDMQPPAASQGFDMGKYFLPEGQFGDIVILRNNWGEGDERTQLQRMLAHSFIVKNSQYEQRYLDNDFIDLQVDTSPGGGNYYTVDGHWLPRYMKVGDTFRRTEVVEVRRKGDCGLVSSFSWTTDIKFVERITTVSFDGGVQVADVARLAWYVDGAIEEEYWYGKGLGLVQWLKSNGNKSWPREIIPVGSQENNVMEVIPCL